jgi:glucose-1-phosphate thymidylyltransferase
VQDQPGGIAEALIIAENFIAGGDICLILGDNIFYGHAIEKFLPQRMQREGAVIFGYQVKNPCRYGVVDLTSDGEIRDIVEKPEVPPSPFAVTGLYYYDNQVVNIAKSLAPSARGELEITDVNREYLSQGQLQMKLLDQGFAWLDTGTPTDLALAANYVQTIQERQGIKIACIEEIAYRKNFIDLEQLEKLADKYLGTEYGQYLAAIVKRESNPLSIAAISS